VNWQRIWAGVVVFFFLTLGIVFGVIGALNLWVGIGVAVLVVLLLWPKSWWRFDVHLVRLLAAAVVAFLALAGVNVFTNAIGIGRLQIWLGLIFAFFVFAAVVFWCLRRDGWSRAPAGIFGLVLAALVLLVAPYVFGRLTTDTETVPTSEHITSELDVLIVGDGSHHPPPPHVDSNPALGEFDIRYSVGYAAGGEVRWTLLNSESYGAALAALARGDRLPAAQSVPEHRPEAESVLLLLPDGTAPVTAEPAAQKNVEGRGGEVTRWSEIALAASPGIPTYALLQTRERARLESWNRFVPRGRAASLQGLEAPAVTDAAAELAIAAPTAQADFALAMAYRPVLLFDHKEPVPWPLSISALFSEERVTLCRDRGVSETDCEDGPLQRPRELENGGTHLQLQLRTSAELRPLAREELRAAKEGGEAATGTTLGAGSAIYVHPVSIIKKERELVYLDYWWYLPENPVGLGGGALCGAGFVIPGVTCLNHESDWEGMTVVIDRTNPKPHIRSVQYAQHDNVVSYSWGELRKRWERPKFQALVANVSDASSRPLAFVARGTHATYPTPCPPNCHQVAKPDVSEEPHDGKLLWAGDLIDTCGQASCVQMLPTREGGAKPALWNAYDGPWGERHCFLTYYCDSGSPPNSPGRQERYKHPASYDGYVDSHWQFQSKAYEEE
jgi:hypothetical protein